MTTRAVTLGYGAGSVGTGGFAVLPGLVLSYYLTDTLGVAAGVASFVLVVPKIWDVLIGPLIGSISDRRSAVTGSRSRGMLIGAVVMPILFVLTFAAPTGWSSAAAASWVFVAFLLAATAYSLFQVPYIALPAELSTVPAARTRLVSVRIAVLAAAILVVGGGGPAVRDAAGGGSRGYLVMAVVAAAVMGAGMVWAVWGTHGRSVTRADVPDASLWVQYREGLAAVRTTPSFRILLSAFVVQALATAVMLASAQYLATYVMDDEAALTGLFAALVGPALLVMPAWYRASVRWGKEVGYRASSTLFLLAALSLVGTLWSVGPWIYVSVGLAGVGYAGMQVFPLAMLPDAIEDDAARGGRSRAGSLSGVWTAAETAGLALGPALFLGVLAVSGFRSSRAGDVVQQPGAVEPAIVLGFSLIPALLVALSLILLRTYAVEKVPA